MIGRRFVDALRVIALAAVTAPAIGCGSTGPFDGSVYRSGRLAYRVPPVPAEWERIDVTDANLAFRDQTHDASILVNARCNARDSDAPLVSLLNHLIIGTTDRSFVEEPQPVPFDGREALQRVLIAKLDGVPMQFDIFVTKKDACVYDFVFVAPPSHFAAGRPAFEQFVHGFHTLPGSGGL